MDNKNLGDYVRAAVFSASLMVPSNQAFAESIGKTDYTPKVTTSTFFPRGGSSQAYVGHMYAAMTQLEASLVAHNGIVFPPDQNEIGNYKRGIIFQSFKAATGEKVYKLLQGPQAYVSGATVKLDNDAYYSLDDFLHLLEKKLAQGLEVRSTSGRQLKTVVTLDNYDRVSDAQMREAEKIAKVNIIIASLKYKDNKLVINTDGVQKYY